MATVKWTTGAKDARKKLYLQGFIQFGSFTAQKTAKRIETIADKLERFPELGYREPLLEGLIPIYRACQINKRFKIIYWYNNDNNEVIIEDIWDVHRAPQNLINRIARE